MTDRALDFAGLFDSSPNPYLVLDRRLYIVGANRAYLDSVRRELADIVDRWAWDAFPSDPQTVQQSIASFERVIATKQPDTMALVRFDVPRPAADGGGMEERYCTISHTPVLDAAGEVALVLQHPVDVTDVRRLREEALSAGQVGGLATTVGSTVEHPKTVAAHHRALKAESDWLRALFLQAPSFIAVLRGPEHRFELTNEAYDRLIGHRKVLGLPVKEALGEIESQGFIDLLDRVYASGEPFIGRGVELLIDRTPGGPQDRHVLDFIYQPIRQPDGTVSGIFVEGNDVTEVHVASSELRERDQQLRLILAAATDYAILTLDLGRLITTWSAGAASIFGYSSEEIIGRSADILFTEEDRAARIPMKETEGADTEGGTPDVRWHLRKDDTRVFLNGVMRPLRDSEGRSVGYLKIARDETSRVAQDDALRNLNSTLEIRVDERTKELLAAEEALRQSQKMEAVGQLTGGLAHDFNNLLTVIIGSLELLETRLDKGRVDDIGRFISASQAAAKRASSLTHRLLAFSRRQTLDPQRIDVNALVAGMTDMIRRTVGPEITVETTGPPDLWMTLVDPSQLENALLNLCINARDAMPEGGRILIEAANTVEDARAARVQDISAGDYVTLAVTDTGDGMPPEVVARVFEPFFTTKPIGQGTGLGLSMVYGFARQSGGQVRIQSEVGKGTTIDIALPRSQGLVADKAEQASDAPGRAEEGQTVLVVDDEPTIRMLIVDVLEELGYVAVEAGNGVAGLELLQSGLRVDLLVTDVGMPGMNGRQLADASRVLRPDLRILFITGYAEAAVVKHDHLEPGMAIMTKPFGLDAIASKIKSLIDDVPGYG